MGTVEGIATDSSTYSDLDTAALSTRLGFRAMSYFKNKGFSQGAFLLG